MTRFLCSQLALSALVLCTTVLCTTVLSTTVAHAQEAAPADFDTLLDRGVRHYQAREYEQAIAAFREAFALRAEPEISYNIARSYERLARPAEAIAEYERFVAMPGTTSELRTRAHASIRALRAELQANEERAAEPTTTAPPPRTAPEPEPRQPPPPPRASEGSVLGPVGWTLFGIGAVSVGVGAAFGVLTIDRNEAFERATLRSEQVRLRDDVKTYALVADVLMIGGGVIAATGLVLAIVDATSGPGGSDTASLVVVPFAGGESAGLTVAGAF